MNDNTGNLVSILYDHVLLNVNRILKNAQNYNISILRLEDPSYAEIAEQLKKACELMELVAEDLPPGHAGVDDQVYTVAKAREYTHFVVKVAEAINDDDEDALKKLCEEMERRPFK